MSNEKIDEIDLEDVPGLGRITALKLRNAGIGSVKQLVLYTAEELEELAKIDPGRAALILRNARALLKAGTKVYTMEEFEKDFYKRELLTTGVSSIDELLGGGLEPASIYEFAGEFGSGKTQLCHQLSITVQLSKNKGGVGGKAFYVDTEGTFSPERIRSIAKRFGINVSVAVKGIFYARPINVEYLEDLVKGDLIGYIESENVRLIIIDSIIALYRAEFRGREFLARRQQRINYILDWLKRIGKSYNTFIVITNQIITAPTGFATIKIPAGGNIIAHASTHRFLMKKADNVWRIESFDSPRIPKGRAALFKITDKGLIDVS
ncbi:MAG: DNA repair and recombination protein RadA [Thermofilum sp. ex4484_79]|nr:MAG: DNA repair and recombination protein RadA [Thermofilum sp. ex4484_79]